MIRNLYLIVLICSFSAHAQDWKRDTCNMNGSVKYVKYESKGGSMPSKRTDEYNYQGFLVNSDRYWSGFFAGHNGIYRIFDESGTHCLKESRAYDKIISQYSNMYYNELGQLEKQILYNDDIHWSTYNYIYDINGNLIEEFVIIQSDLDTIYHYFEYDYQGRMTKDSDISERKKKIKSWEYNEKGILVKMISLDTNWTSATYNEVDKNGDWVVVKKVDNSEIPETNESYIKTYEYNKQGLLIREYTTDIDGTANWELLMTYDENGFLIEKKSINLKEGNIFNITYKYKFDKLGNWVKKITKVNGKLEEEEKRKIKYF